MTDAIRSIIRRMDLIWTSALSICLNLLINRCLGHLRGWRRLLQWPSIYLAVLFTHLLVIAPPIAMVLRWQALWTGVAPWEIDVTFGICAGIASTLAARLLLERGIRATQRRSG